MSYSIIHQSKTVGQKQFIWHLWELAVHFQSLLEHNTPPSQNKWLNERLTCFKAVSHSLSEDLSVFLIHIYSKLVTHADFKRCSRHVDDVNKLQSLIIPMALIMLTTEEPKLEQIRVTWLAQGHFVLALDGGNIPLHPLTLAQMSQAITLPLL